VRCAGETPIEAADLLLENVSDLGSTDSAGVAFVSNLTGDRPMNLSVALASLEDPQWILEPAAVQIVPRAGKVSRVDFAVLLSGEVAGTVRLRSAAGALPAAGVTVELVPVDVTREVRRTRSDYDGFYNFAELRPGYYTLRIPAEVTRRRGIAPVPEHAFVIDRTGPVLAGVDFTLEAAAAAPSAPAPVVAASLGPAPAAAAPPAPVTAAPLAPVGTQRHEAPAAVGAKRPAAPVAVDPRRSLTLVPARGAGDPGCAAARPGGGEGRLRSDAETHGRSARCASGGLHGDALAHHQEGRELRRQDGGRAALTSGATSGS
jgi:hypothetical protein